MRPIQHRPDGAAPLVAPASAILTPAGKATRCRICAARRCRTLDTFSRKPLATGLVLRGS